LAVSLLDWLFPRKLSPDTPQSEKRRTQSTLREPERPVRIHPSEKRPFDTIADAQAAWQATDLARAEKLFKEGVDAYKHSEPDGVDFALGRYGAFLLDQDRADEAMHVLEQAIERRTDIPAIWSDYMRIMSDRRDIDAFKRAAGLMAGAMKHHVEPEFMLAHARRADREGASVFAEAVARWVVDTAASDGDKRGRWAAVGDLGHILERAGRLDEAVILWRGAFDEGSDDPDTAGRLSMQLERNKDYAAATVVIR
jgi:tetratricopeptide (TPR) repeat protein